jgi:hypothetical protein
LQQLAFVGIEIPEAGIAGLQEQAHRWGSSVFCKKKMYYINENVALIKDINFYLF